MFNKKNARPKFKYKILKKETKYSLGSEIKRTYYKVLLCKCVSWNQSTDWFFIIKDKDEKEVYRYRQNLFRNSDGFAAHSVEECKEWIEKFLEEERFKFQNDTYDTISDVEKGTIEI